MPPSPRQKAFLLRAASTTSTKATSSPGQTIASRRLSGSIRVCRWSFVRAEDEALTPSVARCCCRLGGIGADVTVVACTGRNNGVGEVLLLVVFYMVEPLLPSHLLALTLRLPSSHSLPAGRDRTGRDRDSTGRVPRGEDRVGAWRDDQRAGLDLRQAGQDGTKGGRQR